MPKMPERSDLTKHHNLLIHSGSRKGSTPEEEIQLAKQELDAALKEWTVLMAESSGSGSDSVSGGA
jgi:endonuclease IV